MRTKLYDIADSCFVYFVLGTIFWLVGNLIGSGGHFFDFCHRLLTGENFFVVYLPMAMLSLFSTLSILSRGTRGGPVADDDGGDPTLIGGQPLHPPINPTTGLPTYNGIDVSGTPYGCPPSQHHW